MSFYYPQSKIEFVVSSFKSHFGMFIILNFCFRSKSVQRWSCLQLGHQNHRLVGVHPRAGSSNYIWEMDISSWSLFDRSVYSSFLIGKASLCLCFGRWGEWFLFPCYVFDLETNMPLFLGLHSQRHKSSELVTRLWQRQGERRLCRRLRACDQVHQGRRASKVQTRPEEGSWRNYRVHISRCPHWHSFTTIWPRSAGLQYSKIMLHRIPG